MGYSRAVKINNKIYFSGTTSVNEKGLIIGESLYDQTKYIFKKIGNVLRDEGFSFGDVVIVRAFVTDFTDLEEFDKAFKETFSKIKPACTIVGINELVSEELLIEIEVEAEKEN